MEAPTFDDKATSPPHFGVVVVDTDPGLAEFLAGELVGVVGWYTSVEEISSQATVGAGLVVVLGPSLANAADLHAAEAVFRNRTDLGPLLLVEFMTPDLLHRALRAGVRDVLAAPFDREQLVAAVERAGEALQRPLPAFPLPDALDAETAQPAPDATEARKVHNGKVITVFSTKGGAGKSVIAVNMAVMLARKKDQRVILVDADLQFGDVAVMLKLAPQRTIVDAIGNLDKLDSTMIEQLLIRHEASGLDVLAAPLEPSFADRVTASEMRQIVNLLRTVADVIVVDTPAYFNEVVIDLIETSDEILLVAGMDVPNIKNVKIGLQTLKMLNLPLDRVRLILNRAGSKVRLEVVDVERTLGVQADCLVPSDIVVPQCVNKGVAVVLEAPKSGVARAIEQLAARYMVKA
jgi:pilus assembly protein CpaE